MEILLLVLLGLAMGVVFGTALEKSRVFEPGVIVAQLQLRSFIMVKMFMTAVATGLVVLSALEGLGLTELHPKATLVLANIAGGLLMGAGLAIAGACPGTVLAQIGAGYRDAWATVAGGLLGALAFGYAEPGLRPMFLEGGPGKVTYDGLLDLPFWTVALPVAALIVFGLMMLERWQAWRQELGDDLDGLMGPPPAPTAGHPAPAE